MKWECPWILNSLLISPTKPLNTSRMPITLNCPVRWESLYNILISLHKFYLPPYRCLYVVTHAAQALQIHDLSGEGIELWIPYILVWPHKDMKGLPGWVIRPMPGPPPRQHKHQAHTQSSQQGEYGMMITTAKWYPGTLGGPKVSWHLSYRWGKNPEKTSPRKPVPTGDRTRARCVTSAHATTCSTAMDFVKY